MPPFICLSDISCATAFRIPSGKSDADDSQTMARQGMFAEKNDMVVGSLKRLETKASVFKTVEIEKILTSDAGQS